MQKLLVGFVGGFLSAVAVFTLWGYGFGGEGGAGEKSLSEVTLVDAGDVVKMPRISKQNEGDAKAEEEERRGAERCAEALLAAWGTEKSDKAALFNTKQDILAKFGLMFEKFKWDPEKQEAMLELMVQKDMAIDDLFMAYKRGEISQAEYLKLRKEAFSEVQADMHELLGNEDYQLYRRYEYSLQFDTSANAFKTQMSMAGTPLTDDQVLTIQSVLGFVYYDSGLKLNYLPGKVSATAQEVKDYALDRIEADMQVIEKLEVFLDAQQLLALDEYLEASRTNLLLQWLSLFENYPDE